MDSWGRPLDIRRIGGGFDKPQRRNRLYVWFILVVFVVQQCNFFFFPYPTEVMVVHNVKQFASNSYQPSVLESNVMNRSRSLFHYDQIDIDECDLYLNKSWGSMHGTYHKYSEMLGNYSLAVKEFNIGIADIRSVDRNVNLCESLDLLHLFEDGFLSRVNDILVEPLLPPMRHPSFCEHRRKFSLNIDYLVHDFASICKNMKQTSRTVFFDLGASLQYHSGRKRRANPALSLVDVYKRFGIKFDHYYAFEHTKLPSDEVFENIPPNLLPSYHWFNVGVKSDLSSKLNPLNSILRSMKEDDLVVLKLDIDTPAIELPLAHQLLKEPFSKLVDQFYFEHHVRMKGLLYYWRQTAIGSLQDSLDLFTDLRKAGISAHSWV
mmetsp:Transcript_11158/g.26890  ORF Transcript_11158/g.26890 Transcript_11158/m.26890 type:complete len:377 (-) Transcript_11158:248-1378(-)|eukprot:CAMPEP_0113627834 /NCGR_PEP_ID=MMETSP0017_2-20120614/14419_1 /TAXON_ID=2856 /ORGANISM="Cylindrotheca closterium" /LENGTH=376 /DNA_ID=CAMNT_0000538111 /DNA_START=134 /DNA_END=1264 /DNA_ORIENTATION=+ /assembly_acc=CAM_ASM_000147